jgi:8-oxo-dGTP pyrophosphatase MutT (NUDIX family)
MDREIDMQLPETATQPRLAATVVLLRDRAEGPQVYLHERRRGNIYTAGAYVFPGGCVDQKDADSAYEGRSGAFNAQQAAHTLGLGDPLQAWSLYVAALRETFEESALLIGEPREVPPDPERWRLARQEINAGRCSFLDVLERLDFLLLPGALRYLTHWVTPPQEQRRFDTRFFVCRAPADQRAEVDGREALDAGWFAVKEVIQAQREERMKLAPPTYCVLEELAQEPDVATMLARAPNRPIEPVHPRLVGVGESVTVLLPGDGEYAVSRSSAARNRVERVGNHWERIRAR